MTKSVKNCHPNSSRMLRPTPHPTSHPHFSDAMEGCNLQRALVLERKNYARATCPVCMEFPHNAVLLLCSSHDKGCRPYLCGTSYLHSNCFDQFSMVCSKVRCEADLSTLCTVWSSCGIPQISELACPLCRGQVKGWTVVEPARKYLNNKKRNCMQEYCSFVGVYEELEKHVKSEHPNAKPREVEPKSEQDVISTTTLSVPRSTGFICGVLFWVPPRGYGQFGQFRVRIGIGIRKIYIISQDWRLMLPYKKSSASPIDLWLDLDRWHTTGCPPRSWYRRSPRRLRRFLSRGELPSFSAN